MQDKGSVRRLAPAPQGGVQLGVVAAAGDEGVVVAGLDDADERQPILLDQRSNTSAQPLRRGTTPKSRISKPMTSSSMIGPVGKCALLIAIVDGSARNTCVASGTGGTRGKCT